MKCIYCGEEFEQNKTGRKKLYCNKEQCIKNAKKVSNQKYLKKKKEEKRIVKEVKLVNDDETIIYSLEDKLNTESKMPDISDIVEIARQLGSLRFQLIEKIEKDRAIISNCDKADSNLLHALNSLDNVTKGFSKSFTVEVKRNQDIRRIAKNRYFIEKGILDSMLMKNPPRFVSQAIQRSKNYKYVPRETDMEEFKHDKEIYCVVEQESVEVREG